MAEYFPFDVSSIGSYSGSFSGSFRGNGSGITGVTISPSGPNKSIQFNDGGVLNGSNLLTFDNKSNALTITGSLNSSGSLFIKGDIIPTISRSFSLGSATNPWKEIFLQSGSISIRSDIPGDPDTTISNVDGNLLISAGGMQLIGSGTFNAATGSFGYISGSMTQVGDYTQFGNYIMQGDKTITGSLSVTGSTNLNGELYINGQKQFNYGQFSNSRTQTGSADIAYSMTFDNTDFSNGVTLVSGSRITVDNDGLYNIQFSTQLHTTANQAVDFSIWFAMAGSNIANSNTLFTIEKVTGGGYAVGALNFLIQISSKSYIELKWSKTTREGELLAVGTQTTPTRPATPSIIVTVTQVA